MANNRLVRTRCRPPHSRDVNFADSGGVMTSRKPLALFALIALVVVLPFMVGHVLAAPDDAPISALQRGRVA